MAGTTTFRLVYRHSFALSILGMLLLARALAAGPAYAVVEIGTPGSPQNGVNVTGLNEAGQVAGYYQVPGGLRGFIYSSGVFRDIGGFGGTETMALGINNLGQMVGFSTAPGDAYPPGPEFLYQGGVMTDLTPRVPCTPLGINDSGQVIGQMYAASAAHPALHAFLFAGGSQIDLGTLDDWESYPAALNSEGEVVGSSYVNSRQHGFLYSHGRMIDLGSFDPDSYSVGAASINSRHQIVGSVQIHTAGERAFLYQNGKMTNLGTLGGDDSEANCISDNGVIVGESRYRKNIDAFHAFIDEHGKMSDLNDRIPASAGWVLTDAVSINKAGQIAGQGIHDTFYRAFLLTPLPTIAVSGGPRRATTLSQVTVRGRTTSIVTGVVYRNGSNRSQPAVGTKRWHFTVRLHPGKNVITIRAQTLGGHSAPTKVTLTRI